MVIKTDKTEPYREDNNMEEKIIYKIKKYTQAYYSTSTNSFYFITYNDIYDFISGYVSTTNTAITVNNYEVHQTLKNSFNNNFNYGHNYNHSNYLNKIIEFNNLVLNGYNTGINKTKSNRNKFSFINNKKFKF